MDIGRTLAAAVAYLDIGTGPRFRKQESKSKGVEMHPEQENLRGSAAGDHADLDGAMKVAWRPPRVTVIDIRRTMITLGSGSDGVIGST
jgi:hypothetical protein